MATDWIKLNVFQRITRQWDCLHPYNAAQVMSLDHAPDMGALGSAWRSTLRDLGLGPVECDGRRFRWGSLESLSEPVDPVDPGGAITLDQLMTDELNRAFDPGSGLPFRPFILRKAESCHLGVIYHHWVADSYSIRLLLREWLVRLHRPEQSRRTPVAFSPNGYWRLFGPHAANWSLYDAWWAMVRWGAHFRRARRIDRAGFRDISTHFSLHHAPDGLLEALLAASRRLGATVNDLFLAAMARVCDDAVPLQRIPWRPDLVIGTIVDLRSRAPVAMDENFGLYLGFTSIFIRPANLRCNRRLLARIAQQNQAQKQSSAAEASMMRMTMGLVFGRVLKPKRLMEFYRKRAALAAGISNVNLNRDWPSTFHPSPLREYIRVSPVGPMMPVVFTPTTLGRRLNVGLTCRESVISRSEAHKLAALFLTKLRELADT